MSQGHASRSHHHRLRGWFFSIARRARLGFLLIWRGYRPPAEEVDVQRVRSVVRARAMEEMRLAAEDYHWTTLDRNHETVSNE
jgi:hypothetical protein